MQAVQFDSLGKVRRVLDDDLFRVKPAIYWLDFVASISVAWIAFWLTLPRFSPRSEEHTSELQSQSNLVCRLLLEKKKPFLISCLIWLDLVASLPLIKERILVIIFLLHFLSLMLGSVLVLMLPLLVWLTPDLRIKKSLLKCNWTIRKRLPRCKMRLKKRLLAFSRRLYFFLRNTRTTDKFTFSLPNTLRI